MSDKNCVVISYNTVDTLKECIHLLARDGINTVAVDNASDDGSAQYLAREPRVRAILNESNYGSAVARNQGLAACKGDVLLLDGDVVYVPGSYDVLLDQMKAHCVDAVGMDPDCCTRDYADVCKSVPTDLNVKDAWIAYTQYGLFSRALFSVCQFDQKYGPGWGFEDDDLFMQMLNQGIRAKQVAWKYYHQRRSSLVNLGKRNQSGRLKERRSYFNHKWYTLPLHATVEFIVRGLNSDGRSITCDAVDELIRAGHRLPHAINRLTRKVWQYATEHDLREISTDAVAAMLTVVIERQSSLYAWYWSKELSSPQRAALQALSFRAMGMFSSEMLMNDSSSRHCDLLASLVASNVLDECSSLYYFVDPLFAAWIRCKANNKLGICPSSPRIINSRRRLSARFPDFWQPEEPSVNDSSTTIRAEPCDVIYIADRVLCTRRKDGVTIAIDALEARALSSMSSFKSQDGHLSDICGQMLNSLVLRVVDHRLIPTRCALWVKKTISDRIADTKVFPKKIVERASAAIDSLKEKGLLLSAHDLQECLTDAAEPTVLSPRIADIGIVASGRPSSLAQCLATLTNNNRQHESRISCLVIDESSENCLGTRQVIKDYQQSKDLSVWHCSSERRLRMVEMLAAQTSIPRDVIEFAIAPDSVLPSRGGSHNFMSLMTAGKYLLQISDDMYCESSGRQGDRSDTANLARARTADTASPSACKTSVESTLSLHELALGRSVAEIAGRAPSLLADLTDDDIMNLRGRHAYVGITSAGPHLRRGIAVLTARMPFTQVTATPFHACVANAELPETRNLLGLSRAPVFNFFAYGCDNRQLIPPYCPVGIGSEVTFGHLYVKSNSQVWIAHLTRSSEPHINHSIAASFSPATRRCHLSELVTLCISAVSMPQEVTPHGALRILGEHLRAIANLSIKAFQSYLHTLLINQYKQMCENIPEPRETKSSETPHLPTFDDIVPGDLAMVLGTTDALWTTQTLLGKYGQVLCSWQALWDAARRVTAGEMNELQDALQM